MSRYQPLADHLAARGGDEWPASFSELEAVLGFALPKAARAGRTWWGNDLDKSHSRAWAAHGWAVDDVDQAAGRVVFRKGAVSTAVMSAAAAPPGEAVFRAQPPAAREVQPPLLREAAESASARMHATRALGATALVTAGLAVLAGLGAAAARGLSRRRVA